MSIVGAFDTHRRQLTFEYLETVTGEFKRGRVAPADREHLRAWLAWFTGRGDVDFPLEGCTGWRYVARGTGRCRGRGRIWPSRRIPWRCAGRSGTPRPTSPTPGILRVHLMAGDLPES